MRKVWVWVAVAVLATVGLVVGVGILSLRKAPSPVVEDKPESTEVAEVAEPPVPEIEPTVQQRNRKRMRTKGGALLAQATTLAGKGKDAEALEAFEFCVDFWEDQPLEVSEIDRKSGRIFGTQAGTVMLDEGKVYPALRAFSTTAKATGERVNYLYELRARLSDQQREKLWPKGSQRLLLEDFEGSMSTPLAQLAEDTGREAPESVIDSTTKRSGKRSAKLVVGQAAGEGKSWYGLTTPVKLDRKAFGVRLSVKEKTPADTKMVVEYYFPRAKASVYTLYEPAGKPVKGWKTFETNGRLFEECHAHAQKNDYELAEVEIRGIGIVIDKSANTYWVDDIELFVPQPDKEAA